MNGQVLDQRWCPLFIRGWDAQDPAPQLHGMVDVAAAVPGQCAHLLSPSRPARELMAVWFQCLELSSSMQLFGKFRCVLPFLPSQRSWMETSCKLDLTHAPDSLRPSGIWFLKPSVPFPVLLVWRLQGSDGKLLNTSLISSAVNRRVSATGKKSEGAGSEWGTPSPPLFPPDCLITVSPCHN